jgi:hypothetical protein
MGYYDIVRSVPGGTVKKPKPKKPKRYKLRLKANIRVLMSAYNHYRKKYENYQRKPGVLGWVRHIGIVLMSMIVKFPAN